MAKLTVRKDQLETEISYSKYNFSCKVLLKDATQEQLNDLKELGVDIFEKEAKAEKEK